MSMCVISEASTSGLSLQPVGAVLLPLLAFQLLSSSPLDPGSLGDDLVAMGNLNWVLRFNPNRFLK